MVAVLPALRAAIHSPRQVGVGAPYGPSGAIHAKRAAIKLGARFLINSRCDAAKITLKTAHFEKYAIGAGGSRLEPSAPETRTPRKI